MAPDRIYVWSIYIKNNSKAHVELSPLKFRNSNIKSEMKILSLRIKLSSDYSNRFSLQQGDSYMLPEIHFLFQLSENSRY